MRLAPLRNDSVRPPEGGDWRCLKVLCSVPTFRVGAINARSAQKDCQATRCLSPRQEAEWRCCAGGREAGRRARNEGAGTPLRDGPRSGTGGREVWPQARPGCRGALLFGYFLLGTQEKVTRRKGEKERFIQLSGPENKSVPFSLHAERGNDKVPVTVLWQSRLLILI
jgi:hypothetical protein